MADEQHEPAISHRYVRRHAASLPSEATADDDDKRSPARHDHDRVFYTRYFHRLADVTQILQLPPDLGQPEHLADHGVGPGDGGGVVVGFELPGLVFPGQLLVPRVIAVGVRGHLADAEIEIEKAIEAKLYYLGITVALSIPDICASLEFDPDNPAHANSATYAAWCDANMQGMFNNLAGIDLFYLRCGVLHFGHFGHSKSKFNRVIFIGPESQIQVRRDIIATVMSGVSFGGVSAEELRLSGNVLQVDLLYFCKAIVDAASAWSISKANDTHVQRNLPNLVRYRPNGLPPWSIGVPTVA